MCLIALAHRAAPDHPLVLAANRDEFFARESAPAAFRRDPASGRELLAGLDLAAGGSWLGTTRDGRFAAVTNIRDPSRPARGRRSRGELVRDFLTGDAGPEEFAGSLSGGFDEFAGYNLLVGDGSRLFHVDSAAGAVRELPPGVYGLSNGALDGPWPKVRRGREGLRRLLADGGAPSTDALTRMMLDREEAPDAELPDTGVPLEAERRLSPPFVLDAARGYGTRCTTAIVRDRAGAVRFSEHGFDGAGKRTGARFFEFALRA